MGNFAYRVASWGQAWLGRTIVTVGGAGEAATFWPPLTTSMPSIRRQVGRGRLRRSHATVAAPPPAFQLRSAP